MPTEVSEAWGALCSFVLANFHWYPPDDGGNDSSKGSQKIMSLVQMYFHPNIPEDLVMC